MPNPKKSDVYLVSYPKSGNTWMRYLMAYSIWPGLDELDLVEMAAYIPSFHLQHDRKMMLDETMPCNQIQHRVIKEHSPFTMLAKKYVNNAIYVVRDGRDAIVSYWYFCNQRDQTDIPFREFIELSAKPDHSFGPWRDHVEGWLQANLNAKLVIRYEDLLSDTAKYLKQALDFLAIEVPDSNIKSAVERASFSSLKKLEETKGFNLEQLRTVSFVRQGKQGSWRDVFKEGDLELFNRFHGGGVQELGYLW